MAHLDQLVATSVHNMLLLTRSNSVSVASKPIRSAGSSRYPRMRAGKATTSALETWQQGPARPPALYHTNSGNDTRPYHSSKVKKDTHS